MLRKWGTRIGLLLFAILVTLALVEWVLTGHVPTAGSDNFLGPPPQGVDLPYVPLAGADLQFEGHYLKIAPTRVRISKQLLRSDKEFAAPKPAGVTRIVGLGDSFVFGSGVELKETFLVLWEKQLSGVEVINLGVPGYTSGHAVTWFERTGIPLEPDAAVLFISDNDFYDEGRQRLAERREAGETWATKRFVKSRLDRKDKADSSWRKDPSKVLNRLQIAINRFKSACNKAGIAWRIYLLFPHELENKIKDLEPSIERLADDKYLKEITALQIPKDLHPNAKGHARLATLLHQRTRAWIRSLTSSR
jgi:lysophospholipase L1-like esterase